VAVRHAFQRVYDVQDIRVSGPPSDLLTEVSPPAKVAWFIIGIPYNRLSLCAQHGAVGVCMAQGGSLLWH